MITKLLKHAIGKDGIANQRGILLCAVAVLVFCFPTAANLTAAAEPSAAGRAADTAPAFSLFLRSSALQNHAFSAAADRPPFVKFLSTVFAVPADEDVANVFAYPTPFRPFDGHLQITFAFLPEAGSIRVYTSAGDLVRELPFLDPVDGKLSWDVTNGDGEKLGSDVYVYIVKSGGNVKTGKILVIR